MKLNLKENFKISISLQKWSMKKKYKYCDLTTVSELSAIKFIGYFHKYGGCKPN